VHLAFASVIRTLKVHCALVGAELWDTVEGRSEFAPGARRADGSVGRAHSLVRASRANGRIQPPIFLGTGDGANAVFGPVRNGALVVWVNGALQLSTDYVRSGAAVVFNAHCIPAAGAQVLVSSNGVGEFTIARIFEREDGSAEMVAAEGEWGTDAPQPEPCFARTAREAVAYVDGLLERAEK
jgi:hypothetical protein